MAVVKKELEFEPTSIDQSQEKETEIRRQEDERKIAAETARLEAEANEKRRAEAEAEERRLFDLEEKRIQAKALDRNAKFSSKEELARAIPYMRARDEEMVTGVLKTLEGRGLIAEFGLHNYEGEEFEHYKLVDGQEYTLPYAAAWHLNNECYYLEYVEMKDEFGNPTGIKNAMPDKSAGMPRDGKVKNAPMQAFKKVYRYQFLIPGAGKEMYPSGLIEISRTR